MRPAKATPRTLIAWFPNQASDTNSSQYHIRAELSREEAEVESISLKIRQEVWTAYSRLKEAYEGVRATEPLLADAKESSRLAKERYEAGAGAIADLLDAEAALTRADALRIDTYLKYQIARVEFRRSLGQLIP